MERYAFTLSCRQNILFSLSPGSVMVSQVSRAGEIFLGVSELSSRKSNRILIELKRVDTHEQRTKSQSDNQSSKTVFVRSFSL